MTTHRHPQCALTQPASPYTCLSVAHRVGTPLAVPLGRTAAHFPELSHSECFTSLDMCGRTPHGFVDLCPTGRIRCIAYNAAPLPDVDRTLGQVDSVCKRTNR